MPLTSQCLPARQQILLWSAPGFLFPRYPTYLVGIPLSANWEGALWESTYSSRYTSGHRSVGEEEDRSMVEPSYGLHEKQMLGSRYDRRYTSVAFGRGLLESPCKCGIEPPGSLSHGVSLLVYKLET